MKRVFLSATYEDQMDLIEEIKSKLAELGVNVIHFKEPDFYDGRSGIHAHDICIEKVESTPNYLLIISYRAGSDYLGNNPDYQELSLTHAEFHSAYSSISENRKMYCFVRKKVMDFYNIWKELPVRNDNTSFLPVEPKVFKLIDDMQSKGVWIDSFQHSLELKEILTAKEFIAD
ncbi:MAG: DUF4062 domain-containing protein [Nanoarchaeota archaeon]